MEETNNQAEEVLGTDEPIEQLKISDIAAVFIEEARKMGHIILPSIRENEVDISVIRICENNTKQFFDISIKETDTLTIRK